MTNRYISWEIVLAGLTFVAIGIYLSQHSSFSGSERSSMEFRNGFPFPSPPGLPGSIVIDLENLENLEKLESLESLEELGNLEIKLKNLDELIKKRAQNSGDQESLEQSLQEVERELQKIEEADFNVRLQNEKVYIDKDYDVPSAQWSSVSPGVYVYQESFSVADVSNMELNLAFGNVNITGGDSETAELTLRATGDIKDSADLENKLNIHKELSSSGVIDISSAGRSVDSQINLETTLHIPASMMAEVKTSGGHINAQNLLGGNKLTTSGGHISLITIEGETVAQTDGGHISADKLSGEATMATAGGHIRLDNIDGAINARTGGGHIEVAEGRGSLQAKTSGGNISASYLDINGPLDLTTSAGNITLSVPGSINADLEASGTSVQLDDNINFRGDKTTSTVTGTLNEGGYPIVISCGYGTVTINSD